MNVPIRFQGSRVEAIANFGTHDWSYTEDGRECDVCGSKSTHAAALYPCGADVPRKTVEVTR